MSSTSPPPRPKEKVPRARVACVKCRNVKAKCTVEEGADRCTRCIRLKAQCFFSTPSLDGSAMKRTCDPRAGDGGGEGDGKKRRPPAKPSGAATHHAAMPAPYPRHGAAAAYGASSSSSFSSLLPSSFAPREGLTLGVEAFMAQSVASVGLGFDSPSSLVVTNEGAHSAVFDSASIPVR